METFNFSKTDITPETVAETLGVKSTDVEVIKNGTSIVVNYKGSSSLSATKKNALTALIEGVNGFKKA